MTFDEYLIWIEEGVRRLRKQKLPRERRNHVRRLCRILIDADCWDAVRWEEVAQKIAAHLEESPPELPSGTPSRLGMDAAERAAIRPVLPALPKPSRSSKRAPKREPRTGRRRATRPAREPIQMNEELEAAFRAVDIGKQIIFVTGGAGTGKSTFIRELRERFPERDQVVLAPTGVAALNAGAQTIHSFCGFPLRPVVESDVRQLDDSAADRRQVIENLDLLIVDEVSMVRADILDALERFLRINRGSAIPFGGVQMVLVGDLFQLPPVVTREDEPFLAERYPSPFFFSASCLRGLSFAPVELQIIYRQSEEEFTRLLRDLRDGQNVEASVARINRLCVGRRIDGPHVILVPTRRAAAALNEVRLGELSSRELVFEAATVGSFAGKGEESLPAPKRLALKRGAQVMFTRNDPERRWVNGTLGTVERLKKESVSVRLRDGDVHEVDLAEWQDIDYAFDKKENRVVEEIAGTYTQYPLMLAWSVTIHKAQGLTLERVAVDLGRGAFADGQVYVALSRCQSIEGLSLTRPVRAGEVRCSEAARGFYAKMQRRSQAPS
jgi:hypothetical protein